MTVGPITPRSPAPAPQVADRQTMLTVLAARTTLAQAGERAAQQAETTQRVQESGSTFDARA